MDSRSGQLRHREPQRRIGRKTLLWICAGTTVVTVALFAVALGPLVSSVEEPIYTTTLSSGPLEVRSYGPLIAAEAVVHGERKAAVREGFRLIAAYIFGENVPRATVQMTAPVLQQRQQPIAMTAPVTQQGEGDAWKVRFIMPRSWTMETLPAPTDARVTLRPIRAKRFAVIRFSGRGSDANIEAATEELRRYLLTQKLDGTGEPPLLAFYNPPWALPFLRRNEIMLELSGGSS